MPKEGSSSKPGKAKAPAAAAPEPELTKGEAVEELAQALLREYMHRKGAKAALGIFDEESPRTDKTIKSRAVMTSLMSMQAIQARCAQLDPAPATFMEQLCAYRLRKRRIAKGDTDAAADDSSAAEDGPSATEAALADTRARIAQLRTQLDAAKDERETAVNEATAKAQAAAAASGDDGAKKSKKEKKAKKEKKSTDDGADDKKKAKKAKKAAAEDSKRSSKFDPLGLGGGSAPAEDEGPSLLAGRSGSGSGGFGGHVGHAWNPAGVSIPEVGLGSHGSAPPSGAASGGSGKEGDGAPSEPAAVKFLAGNGMNLMATKVRAVADKESLHFDDSPAKGKRRPSLDAAAEPGSPQWEYEYPSPENGRQQYDPSAAGSGVLKKEKKPRSERRVVIMGAEEHE